MSYTNFYPIDEYGSEYPGLDNDDSPLIRYFGGNSIVFESSTGEPYNSGCDYSHYSITSQEAAGLLPRKPEPSYDPMAIFEEAPGHVGILPPSAADYEFFQVPAVPECPEDHAHRQEVYWQIRNAHDAHVQRVNSRLADTSSGNVSSRSQAGPSTSRSGPSTPKSSLPKIPATPVRQLPQRTRQVPPRGPVILTSPSPKTTTPTKTQKDSPRGPVVSADSPKNATPTKMLQEFKCTNPGCNKTYSHVESRRRHMRHCEKGATSGY